MSRRHVTSKRNISGLHQFAVLRRNRARATPVLDQPVLLPAQAQQLPVPLPHQEQLALFRTPERPLPRHKQPQRRSRARSHSALPHRATSATFVSTDDNVLSLAQLSHLFAVDTKNLICHHCKTEKFSKLFTFGLHFQLVHNTIIEGSPKPPLDSTSPSSTAIRAQSADALLSVCSSPSPFEPPLGPEPLVHTGLSPSPNSSGSSNFQTPDSQQSSPQPLPASPSRVRPGVLARISAGTSTIASRLIPSATQTVEVYKQDSPCPIHLHPTAWTTRPASSVTCTCSPSSSRTRNRGQPTGHFDRHHVFHPNK